MSGKHAGMRHGETEGVRNQGPYVSRDQEKKQVKEASFSSMCTGKHEKTE